MSFRFVHAADIHLDSPLRSLALRDPALAELVGNATRRAFSRIVDLCLDEQVDALLLTGDLYDGDQTSMKTARFLAQELRRLHEAGIRSFIIRGNHDALSKITKELTLPDSVKVFGGRADTVMLEHKSLPVAIHGLSFAQSHAPDSLLGRYRPPVEGALNIGLMHTSLGGTPHHSPYAPCSAADLRAAGFRYWALGHIHGRSVLEGDCAVVMAGMPQGRDINEAGAKSVTLVTVGDDGTVSIAERVTSVAQFERVSVDATGLDDWRDLVAAIAGALEQARDAVEADHLVARLKIEGTTPLAWRIRRDADLLKTEADDRAGMIGRSWVEKLEIACLAPGVLPGGPAGPSIDPLSELRRLIEDEIIGSDGYGAQIEAIAEELRGQLPPECRDIFGQDEASVRRAVAELARDGAQDVLARLHGPQPGGA